jgi:hypothetical protein
VVVVVGIGYTGRGGEAGSTANMTVHRALRPVKISHNVEEHAEWVHAVQVTHSPRCVIGVAEYVVCRLVKSTEVNLDVLTH